MGRVIFINPFASTRISGGIKSTYQHAELLTELGYTVVVFQPSGPPTWCSPHLRALCRTGWALPPATFSFFRRR